MKEKYYKIINLVLISIIILLLPIPRYKVDLPGRGRLVSDTYEFVDETEQSIYFPYVLARNANVFYYISSFFRNDIDLYQYKESFFRDDDYETITEIGRESVNEAFYNALIWLHNYKELEHEITNQRIVVKEVLDESDFDLKPGDLLIKADGVKLDTSDDLKEIFESYNNEIVNIVVLRDDEQIELSGTLIYDDELERYLVGFLAVDDFDLKTDIGFEISDQRRMIGSSGGLATALSIYYTYNEVDLPFDVYATGTINRNGDVFKIGGVKQKLIGADKRADLFVFPKDNEEEVKDIIDQFDISTEVIFVDNVEEAINIINNKVK